MVDMAEDDTQAMTLRLPRLLHEWLRRTAFEQRKPMNEIVIAAIEKEKDGDGNVARLPDHRTRRAVRGPCRRVRRISADRRMAPGAPLAVPGAAGVVQVIDQVVELVSGELPDLPRADVEDLGEERRVSPGVEAMPSGAELVSAPGVGFSAASPALACCSARAFMMERNASLKSRSTLPSRMS
jgi:hypothetical protein